MNVKRIPKPTPVHKVAETREETGIVIAICGHWFSHDTYTETTEEVTCKSCMQYLEGGLTAQERSRE